MEIPCKAVTWLQMKFTASIYIGNRIQHLAKLEKDNMITTADDTGLNINLHSMIHQNPFPDFNKVKPSWLKEAKTWRSEDGFVMECVSHQPRTSGHFAEMDPRLMVPEWWKNGVISGFYYFPSFDL